MQHAGGRFNFDDAMAAATRSVARASVAPQQYGFNGNTTIPQQQQQQQQQPPRTLPLRLPGQSVVPAFDTATVGGSRSNSVSSFAGCGSVMDEAETVGGLLERWGYQQQQQQAPAAMMQQSHMTHHLGSTLGQRAGSTTGAQYHLGMTASHPGSATNTPRGDAVMHAVPTGMPSQFSATAVEVHSLEQMNRRATHEAMRLAQLDAEEAQLAAEERALTQEMRDITARHRNVDVAMLGMQQEWSELFTAERALRLEPLLDLSVDIAHAEGQVDAIRRRVEDVEGKLSVVSAQLSVVDQVEQKKAQQLAAIAELEATFKNTAMRKAKLVQWIEQQASVDAGRESVAKQAYMLLDSAERAVSGGQMPAVAGRAPLAPLSATVPVPPALKGSRAAAANATTTRLSTSRGTSQQLRHRSASVGGVSFAVDTDDDGDDDVADAVVNPGAPQPSFVDTGSAFDMASISLAAGPDDISGISFAFPSVATVLGNKRTRPEQSMPLA